MAKDYRRKCPDCDGIDVMGTLFGSKGDGRCSNCRGEGKILDPIVAVAAPFLGLDSYKTCEVCNGTGQCQTCGGTGFEYYNDDSYINASGGNDEPKGNYNDTSTYGDYNYAGSSSNNRSADNNSWESSNGCLSAIGGILILWFIIWGAIKLFSSNNNSQNVQQQTQPQIEACDANNTGDYAFVNTTSRGIFVFMSSINWSKTIEVPPNQTYTEHGLNAYSTPYQYQYSYYNSTDFDNDKFGSFLVEKCQTKTLELNLPLAYWYKLSPISWMGIDVPSDCCYAVVAPYEDFSFKFSENDSVRRGHSWTLIPDTVKRIFLSHLYPNYQMEISIEKYDPTRKRGTNKIR